MQCGELRSGVDDALEVDDGDAAAVQAKGGQPREGGGAGRWCRQGRAAGDVEHLERLAWQGPKPERAPEVEAVDVDAELLDAPRRRVGEHGVEQVVLHQGFVVSPLHIMQRKFRRPS